MKSLSVASAWLAAAVVLVPLGACSMGPSMDPYAPTATEEQMYAHFREALEMRAGAIFGDPDRIREAGRRLAGAPTVDGMPPGSERFARELRQAADAAASAERPSAARRAAADVARNCGTCHEAYRVGPEFLVGAPQPGESLLHHMARQTRISRLLWDGLIAPSDRTWDEGAQELQSEPPFPREVAARVQDAQVLDEAQSRLRALGARAAAAEDPQVRSEVLAEVWGVCAGCHQLVGQLGN